MNILVVEDEPKVQKFIAESLRQSGMVVETLSALSDLQEYLSRKIFDVLVLDRLLEGRDSIALLPSLRKSFPDLRILMLTALGDVDQRVLGLSRGADDYLAKPFHVAELVERVRALGRRSSPEAGKNQELSFEGLLLLTDRLEAKYQSQSIELTSKEFKLLSLFLSRKGSVITRSELLDRVWGLNFDPESNVVEATIKRLRQKMAAVGAPDWIHTRRGAGYWFGEPASET